MQGDLQCGRCTAPAEGGSTAERLWHQLPTVVSVQSQPQPIAAGTECVVWCIRCVLRVCDTHLHTYTHSHTHTHTYGMHAHTQTPHTWTYHTYYMSTRQVRACSFNQSKPITHATVFLYACARQRHSNERTQSFPTLEPAHTCNHTHTDRCQCIHTPMYVHNIYAGTTSVCLHVVVIKYLLPVSNFRCWWCCSCSPSKFEVFEEGHCAGHEPCASVTNCWLVREFAGGVSLFLRTLWGRYEMCIQMV